MKKVLFLAYYFPPLGGAGVQRVAKFVKYLPDFGYKPLVVAGSSQAVHNGVIPRDETLCEEVKHARLYAITCTASEHLLNRMGQHKISGRIPGLAFQGWMRAARRACVEAIRSEKPDVIYVTVSPFQAARVAREVAEAHRIPWVLDMRDPWALDPITTYPSWIHYRLQWLAMRQACQAADGVIMNTPRSLKLVKETFFRLPTNKLSCITNGWDPDDLKRQMSHAEKSLSKKMTIVHTGTLHSRSALAVDPTSRRELGLSDTIWSDRIRYGSGKSHLLARTPYYLFRAIRHLLDEGRIDKEDIYMIFAGSDTQADRDLARRFDLEEMVSFKGYLHHDESIGLLASADVLFVPLHVSQNGQYPLIIPGKIYEYLSMGKPVLALVPKGDARDLLQKSGLGVVCDPTDVGQISQAVLSLLERFRSSTGLKMQAQEDVVKQFDRRQLTRKLAVMLDFAIGS